MSQPFLIQVHIGPIQGFIATARRTRDLWFGSYLLSEISKAAARGLLKHQGVRLTFPAADREAVEADSPLSVVNVVLAEAEVADRAAALAVARSAQVEAQAHWAALCDEAWAKLDGDGERRLRADIWKAQLGEVLEVFYAVVPLDSHSYSHCVDEVRSLMAARKGLRKVDPVQGEPAGLPKSSLDGQRSTVLQNDNREDPKARASWAKWRRRIGVGHREQLDLAGMVKRVMGRESSFVPVGRLALAPWLDQVLAAGETSGRQALNDACEELVNEKAAAFSRVDTTLYPWAADFPYDGQLAYRERLEAWRQEWLGTDGGLEAAERLKLTRRIQAFTDALDTLAKKAKVDTQPNPYYALLLADGDRMGELLDAAASADEHREVSRCLAEFAAQVPGWINAAQVGGACIYAGGDDVLALLRVDRAIEAAKELAKLFALSMAPSLQVINTRRVAQGLPPAQAPSLSVGLAVCHMLEPLSDARELAKAAEHLAKEGRRGTSKALQRNALGVMVKPRGGGALSVRLRWDDDEGLKRLKRYAGWFEAGELPAGLPYELRELLAETRAVFQPGQGNPAEQLHDLLWSGSVRRTLSRKRRPVDEQPLRQDVVSAMSEQLKEAPTETIDSLMLARWLTGQAQEGR